MPNLDILTDQNGGQIKQPELHDYLAFWLHRLSSAILQTFERNLSETGITHPQWAILVSIYRENADTPKSLSEYIGVDSGSVSRSIDRLVAKKLLEKKPNIEDRRSINLVLTPSGKTAIEGLLNDATEQEEQWRSCLSKEELTSFSQSLHKLLLAQGVTPGGKYWNKKEKLKNQKAT